MASSKGSVLPLIMLFIIGFILTQVMLSLARANKYDDRHNNNHRHSQNNHRHNNKNHRPAGFK